MVGVNRPVQRLVIIVLALVLALPLGALGISQLMGPGSQDALPEAVENPDNRPTVDPAEQPARPDHPRPPEPAALEEQTAEGAQAALTYLLDSYAYMMSSGDVTVWEGAIDPKCQVCTTFMGNAQLLDQQEGYLVGGEFEVHETFFDPTGDPPATGRVTADFTQAAGTLVDTPTLQPYELESERGQIIAEVAWDGERWRVTDMQLAPLPQASDGGEG